MGYLSVTLSMTGRFLLSFTLSSYWIWVAELFPTQIRGEAFGILVLGIRMGGATAPFVVKSLRHVHRYTPFLTMASLGITSVLLFIKLPETKEYISEDECTENNNDTNDSLATTYHGPYCLFDFNDSGR